MAKKPPVPFKSALREYAEFYLGGRLSEQDISLVLRRHENWMRDFLRKDGMGIAPDVLERLYVLMPELMFDVEDGIIGQPVVRGPGRPPVE